MSLISVDLPAPLSPMRPSTSPLRRCIVTPSSAISAPKRLTMFSTLRMSLSSSSGGVTSSLSRTAQASDVDVQSHGDEDRDAQDDVERVCAHALQRESVAQDGQHS